MVPTIVSFGALLASVFILWLGNGMMGTLLAIRANIEAFDPSVIGLLMSGYFVGFIAGCFRGQWVVVRVGHIRAFSVFAVVAASAALVYPLVPDPWVWWGLRVVTGFCFAGLYMVIESWLNDQSTNETRGATFSAYRITDMTAITLSQMLLTVAPVEGFTLFSISAILVALCVVPVALTLSMQPAPVRRADVQMRWLYKKSPLGVAASGLFGVVNGAFWGLTPVYLQNIGRVVDDIAVFMSLAIISGAISQWPIGKLSDLYDRRLVLTITTFLAAIACMLTATMPGLTGYLMPFAILFGFFNFPIYGLAVAHTNDYLADDEFLTAASGLLLAFGAGAVLGPIIAPGAMYILGPGGLFWFMGALFAGLGLFALYRMTAREAVPAEDQGDYQSVMQMVPAAFELDDRASEVPEEDLMVYEGPGSPDYQPEGQTEDQAEDQAEDQPEKRQ